MLARVPKPNDDGPDGVDVFWPLIGLAVLTGGWTVFCWYLAHHVTDHGVIKGMTVMAWISGVSTVVWLVVAWVMRPRKG